MRRQSSIVVVLAALAHVSCGSHPAAPTSTNPLPLAITGATTLNEVRDSVQLSLLNGTADVTNPAVWQSSNAGVATVSFGLVRATGPGTATISATYQQQTITASFAVAQDDDCSSYDPSSVGTLANTHDSPPSISITVPFPGGGFELLAAADNATDATNLVAVFQRYSQYCNLGRNNARPNRLQYIVNYFKGASGRQTTITPEDCVAYNASALQVVNRGASGWALMSGGTQLALLDTQLEASLLSAVAARASSECFIGRGNARANSYGYITEYWK